MFTFVLALLAFLFMVTAKAAGLADYSMMTVFGPFILWLATFMVGLIEISFWRLIGKKFGGN